MKNKIKSYLLSTTRNPNTFNMIFGIHLLLIGIGIANGWILLIVIPVLLYLGAMYYAIKLNKEDLDG